MKDLPVEIILETYYLNSNINKCISNIILKIINKNKFNKINKNKFNNLKPLNKQFSNKKETIILTHMLSKIKLLYINHYDKQKKIKNELIKNATNSNGEICGIGAYIIARINGMPQLTLMEDIEQFYIYLSVWDRHLQL